MDPLDATLLALELLLALVAWGYARRHRSHRAVAAYLTWMALEGPARDMLRTFRSGPSVDLQGLGLISFELDKLIVLSWTFGFVALCVHYFLRRRVWWVGGIWLGVWALSIPHPWMTGTTLFRLYSVVFTAGVMASWAAILWTLVARPAAVEPRLAHWVLLAYASFDFVGALAPFVELEFVTQWEQLRLASILVTAGSVGAHLYWRRMHRTEVKSLGR